MGFYGRVFLFRRRGDYITFIVVDDYLLACDLPYDDDIYHDMTAFLLFPFTSFHSIT